MQGIWKVMFLFWERTSRTTNYERINNPREQLYNRYCSNKQQQAHRGSRALNGLDHRQIHKQAAAPHPHTKESRSHDKNASLCSVLRTRRELRAV